MSVRFSINLFILLPCTSYTCSTFNSAWVYQFSTILPWFLSSSLMNILFRFMLYFSMRSCSHAFPSRTFTQLYSIWISALIADFHPPVSLQWFSSASAFSTIRWWKKCLSTGNHLIDVWWYPHRQNQIYMCEIFRLQVVHKWFNSKFTWISRDLRTSLKLGPFSSSLSSGSDMVAVCFCEARRMANIDSILALDEICWAWHSSR